ncbi:hypothetical protein Tco_0986117 [Tanacetum coccineum]
MVENASGATTKGVLSVDIVTQYYNKKLLYDKYCNKMLKRRSSKIINCDVLTQKGPITLQVYREDGTVEVISNVKFSDLYLAEWKEVVQACPDRKEKGWKTIYGLIKTRMEYLHETKKEFKIDFNKPLKEQHPLNELNELANKKRKRTSDLKDHSSGTETEEGLWKELQFSLVDNFRLNIVGSRKNNPLLFLRCSCCVVGDFKRGFLSQKDNGRGRGVKDKDVNDISIRAVKDGAIPCDTGAAGNMRVENVGQSSPVGVVSAVKKGVTPSMVDMMMEMEKLSSLEHTTVLGSFLPLSTSVTTTANNAPGKSSYAIVTGKLSGNKLNIRTLFKLRGNGIYVVVPIESIRAISE